MVEVECALIAQSAGVHGEPHLRRVDREHLGVTMPFKFRTPAGVLSLISTTTIFGTRVDITLQELAMETLLPADAFIIAPTPTPIPTPDPSPTPTPDPTPVPTPVPDPVPPAPTGANPILFATQATVSGFTSRTSTFGNHLSTAQSAPRGGDLMIRYSEGSLRNLTREAGFGSAGFQGANAVAVREPLVRWSGSKALVSMVIGSPDRQYVWQDYYWQIYEASGLHKGAAVQITKVPNQPGTFNSVSQFYASDERVLFTSDRPHGG